MRSFGKQTMTYLKARVCVVSNEAKFFHSWWTNLFIFSSGNNNTFNVKLSKAIPSNLLLWIIKYSHHVEPNLPFKFHVTIMLQKVRELTKLLACTWCQVVEVSVFQCNFERETYLWDILWGTACLALTYIPQIPGSKFKQICELFVWNS